MSTGFYPAMKHPMMPKDALKNKVAFITGGGTGLYSYVILNLKMKLLDISIKYNEQQILYFRRSR